MDIKKELKKMVYDMMLEEIKKVDYQNDLSFNRVYYGEKKAMAVYEYSTYMADQVGYEVGLKYKEYVTENMGKLPIGYVIEYPDVTRIAAKNLLLKYNLEYPNCFSINNKTIEYLTAEELEQNYISFLMQVKELFKENRITDFERKRLYLAGKYFYNCDLISLAYANMDDYKKTR